MAPEIASAQDLKKHRRRAIGLANDVEDIPPDEMSWSDRVIPPWSMQDRYNRVVVVNRLLLVVLRSNLVVGIVFMLTFVLPRLHWSNSHIKQEACTSSAWILVAFILWHFVTTLCKSIPDDTSTPEELSKRTNATTFVAMTLYPCIGLWLLQRDATFVSSHDNGTATRRHSILCPWYSFVMWGMSALILLRDSYHSEVVDRPWVISDENGKAVTGLYRHFPNRLESFTRSVGRNLTLSLWHCLPEARRPTGGAGRFLFQLFAPVVILFVYVAYRFAEYSGETIIALIQLGSNSCTRHRHIPEIESDQAQAGLIVWSSFALHCILVRGILPNTLFLRAVVRDCQTWRWLETKWAHTTADSTRSRVLWSFRGLAHAFVIWWRCKFCDGALEVDPLSRTLPWLLLLSVYISFFMEGAGVFFFALHEAERGCDLKTPFVDIMELFFWAAFNAFLQPLGTLANVFFYVINRECKKDCVLREIWGPTIDRHGNCRIELRNLRNLFHSNELPSEEQTAVDVMDWIATWKRKQRDAGKCEEGIVLKAFEGTDTLRSLPVVFHGTVFPMQNEWLRMCDEPLQHLTLKPWETQFAPEKLRQWYPAYAEQVRGFLQIPYNFEVQRQVWVFGYGSFMSPDSPPAGLSARQKQQLIPYWLKKEAGFDRVWNYRHGTCGVNALGLLSHQEGLGTDICGVVYPMDYEMASDLFSKREDGYELLFLHEAYFAPMHPDYEIPKGVGYVWVCGPPRALCSDPERPCSDPKCKRHWPTEDSPILQSYVDEVIIGALRFKTNAMGHTDGMRFAAAIIASTGGWNRPWFNDRLLAGRPWKFSPEYEIIDGLLSTCPTSAEGFLRRLHPAAVMCTERRAVLQCEAAQYAPWAREFYSTLAGEARGVKHVEEHSSNDNCVFSENRVKHDQRMPLLC